MCNPFANSIQNLTPLKKNETKSFFAKKKVLEYVKFESFWKFHMSVEKPKKSKRRFKAIYLEVLLMKSSKGFSLRFGG